MLSCNFLNSVSLFPGKIVVAAKAPCFKAGGNFLVLAGIYKLHGDPPTQDGARYPCQ